MRPCPLERRELATGATYGHLRPPPGGKKRKIFLALAALGAQGACDRSDVGPLGARENTLFLPDGLAFTGPPGAVRWIGQPALFFSPFEIEEGSTRGGGDPRSGGVRGGIYFPPAGGVGGSAPRLAEGPSEEPPA